jgi:CheY-like chemotaxis protein
MHCLETRLGRRFAYCAERMEELRGTVLIVDDEPGTSQLIAALLSGSGYQVLSAEDGLEALHVLRVVRRGSTAPCLVLLDLTMPRLGGGEFRRAQLLDPTISSVPIAVISGALDAPEQARAMGAMANLTKPIDIDTLLAIVQRYCA